jgi:hypothetical protein
MVSYPNDTSAVRLSANALQAIDPIQIIVLLIELTMSKYAEIRNYILKEMNYCNEMKVMLPDEWPKTAKPSCVITLVVLYSSGNQSAFSFPFNNQSSVTKLECRASDEHENLSQIVGFTVKTPRSVSIWQLAEKLKLRRATPASTLASKAFVWQSQ